MIKLLREKTLGFIHNVGETFAIQSSFDILKLVGVNLKSAKVFSLKSLIIYSI